ncbi:DNA-3-methyladenine glycosylase [bacterium]|nr:DNA-3-methyladenine glycosylase [bacterium]
MNFLPPEFYRRPVLTVARELLGKIFVRKLDGQLLSGRIVEVEAYHQDGDESAHSYGGEKGRNRVMFRDGGLLYVYFTYGMHFCMNVVVEGEGTGAAVLLRAIEPMDGIEVMRENRGGDKKDVDLSNGPAKLCQALGIAREENGLPLDGGVVGILDVEAVSSSKIAVSTRIGISRSKELPWRFFLENNPFVSRGRPSGTRD